MHELHRPQQIAVLKEALHVAHRCIIIDSVVRFLKMPEDWLSFCGSDNRSRPLQNFKSFLPRWYTGILQESGLPVNIEYSSVFWRNVARSWSFLCEDNLYSDIIKVTLCLNKSGGSQWNLNGVCLRFFKLGYLINSIPVIFHHLHRKRSSMTRIYHFYTFVNQ